MSREAHIAFFKEADADNSGELTFQELYGLLKKKGYRGAEREVKKMFHTVDASGDGKISMKEYMEAMGLQPPEQHKGAAMRRVFHEFDTDNSGTVSKAELQAVFKEMGKYLSDDDVQRIMKMADTDGSGELSYEEFIKQVFGVDA